MKLKLSELKPNPYKKFINEGKLNEEQIESISKNLDKLGLMGSIPVVKRDDKYYIVNSHHRVEALKRKFGKDYQVEVTLHKYDDAQLLQGMVIENLTQRRNDFREELENVLAVKTYLEKSGVRSSDTCDSLGREKHQNESQGIGARQISEFLNNVICKSKVAELLRVYENIPKKLIDEATHKQGETDANTLRYDQLVTLSKLKDKKEINDLAEALKNSRNQRVLDHRNFINQYIGASEDIKQKVRDKLIDIADISNFVESDEPVEEIFEMPEDDFNNLQKMLDAERVEQKKYLNTPEGREQARLFRSWVAHAKANTDDMTCPNCGKDSSYLKWVCCDIEIDAATDKLRTKLNKKKKVRR